MKHDFEERRQNRISRAKSRAVKNEQEAERLFDQANQMVGAIPMGQPILVGHHSEGRDRKYRAKIDSTARKAIEAGKKADYYADLAECISRNDAIFSDDPQAVEKLTRKITTLKYIQEFMKTANKLVKKQDERAFLNLAYGTAVLWAQLNVPDRLHGIGFPSFKLTNNGANIRKLEERLAKLKKRENREDVDKTVNRIRIYGNSAANRLQLFFPGNPADNVRGRLKAEGFRWSPGKGAWQRHISQGAYSAALRIVEAV